MKKQKPSPAPSGLTVEVVPLSSLKPHPKNYREHPDDQLDHIAASIRAHGFYRNIVVAKDGTVLAGHGVTKAAARMGLKEVPVQRLNIEPDSPAALKVLTSDNEISKLAEVNDRALTDMLKSLVDLEGPGALLGTGFNEEQLAALAMVTRPAHELADLDAAAAWVGMPEYEEGGTQHKLVITFLTPEDREAFAKKIDLRIDKSAVKGNTWTTRWPWTDREDPSSVRFETETVTP